MLYRSISRLSPTAVKFEPPNWVAANAMSDKHLQSQRLHEPAFRVDTTDSMTAEHITDIKKDVQ